MNKKKIIGGIMLMLVLPVLAGFFTLMEIIPIWKFGIYLQNLIGGVLVSFMLGSCVGLLVGGVSLYESGVEK